MPWLEERDIAIVYAPISRCWKQEGGLSAARHVKGDSTHMTIPHDSLLVTPKDSSNGNYWVYRNNPPPGRQEAMVWTTRRYITQIATSAEWSIISPHAIAPLATPIQNMPDITSTLSSGFVAPIIRTKIHLSISSSHIDATGNGDWKHWKQVGKGLWAEVNGLWADFKIAKSLFLFCQYDVLR